MRCFMYRLTPLALSMPSVHVLVSTSYQWRATWSQAERRTKLRLSVARLGTSVLRGAGPQIGGEALLRPSTCEALSLSGHVTGMR